MHARVGLRHAALVAVIAVVLLTTSCGGGRRWVASGELEIYNSPFSFEFVDAIRVVESFGPDLFFVETFLLPGESLLLDRLYDIYYDVTIYWSDGTQDTYFEVEVPRGWTTLLEVEN